MTGMTDASELDRNFSKKIEKLRESGTIIAEFPYEDLASLQEAVRKYGEIERQIAQKSSMAYVDYENILELEEEHYRARIRLVVSHRCIWLNHGEGETYEVCRNEMLETLYLTPKSLHMNTDGSYQFVGYVYHVETSCYTRSEWTDTYIVTTDADGERTLIVEYRG